MKIRGTGPIPVVVATIFSLSAIVALAAAGGTIAQENLTVQASTAATNFPRQPSSGIVLDGKNPVGPTAAIGLPTRVRRAGRSPPTLAVSPTAAAPTYWASRQRLIRIYR